MPRFKVKPFGLLAAICLLFVALPSAAADTTVDVWPVGRMPGRGAKKAEADRPPKGDGLHFSADAEKELGARFARAMLELQK